MSTPELLWWVVFLGGLLGTALLSGLETGIYRLSRVKLEVRAAAGDSAALLLKREVAEPQRLLSANLIANIFFGDLAATGATNILALWGYSDGAIVAINVMILTPVFFVFVESVPKELFRLETDTLTYRFARPLAGLRVLLTFTGVLALLRLITGTAMRVIGAKADEELVTTGRERLVTLLKDTAGEGDAPAPLSESQAKLLDRALEFGRTSVADEMLPWPRVQSIRPGWNRSTVMGMLARFPASFLPVVDREASGRQKVVGIIRARDLLTRVDTPMSRLTLGPARLPPRTSLRDAVVRLREAAVPVGIIEEGGRPLGLITLSDLIEPLLRLDER
jgi:putative hemolysin